MKRHYAKKIPSISYAFGLFKKNKLEGVISYGLPASAPEYIAWKPFKLLELNRLVIKEGHIKNLVSFFISKTFKLIPSPTVLISYSDYNQGHIGYVYQATNWIYTGVGKGSKMFLLQDGTIKHSRHIGKENSTNIKEIYKSTGKARYYYFLGNKKEKKEMKKMLRFPILPYPKGESKRYDASAKLPISLKSFL